MPMTSLPASSTRPTPVGSSTRCARGLEEFALSLHPEKTRLIEFGRHRGGRTASSAGWASRRPSTSWASPSSAARPARAASSQQEDTARPHAGEAPGDQGGTAAAHAPADLRTGEMAEAGRERVLQLPRRADQQPSTRGLPIPCRRSLAAHAAAAQPEGPHDMGPDRRSWPTTGSPNPVSFIPGQACALPSNTRGGSRMRESRTYGSVRGARSNGRPYRDSRLPARWVLHVGVFLGQSRITPNMSNFS